MKIKQILNCFREDSRQSLTSISEKIHMPLSTVSNNARRANQFIDKYTPLLNYSKLGYIQIHLISKTNIKSKHVNNLFELSNGNFHAECIFKNMREIVKFRNNNKGTIVKQFMVRENISKESFRLQ